MNQAFRITIEHYDQRVCVEVDHSDVSAAEAVELFQRAMRAAGFDFVNVRIDDATGDVNHDVDADRDAADALLGGNIANEFLGWFNDKPKRGEIVEVSNDGIDWETRVFDWHDGKVYRVPATHRDEIKMHNGGLDYLTNRFKYCRKIDGELFTYA
jgi:hypothetical protein